MFKGKRGQKITEAPSGGAAGAVLAITTLILVMYVVFLPPTERAKLLDDDAFVSGTYNKTLFEASELVIAHSDDATTTHHIPNLYLVETKNAVTFESYNPFIVERGWFRKRSEIVRFSFDDPNIVQNVYLSFDAPKRNGPLRILLNGRVVFAGEPQSTSVGPIKLRNKYLERENELVLETDGVGLAFWKTHQYNIENAKIVGDITDVATQESLNTIVLSEAEIASLERAVLDYFVVCQNEDGVMDVFLNQRRVSGGVPVCDTPNRIELDAEDLNAGKNEVLFSVDRGAYRLEDIVLKLYLKEPVPWLDYFDVTDADYNALRSGATGVITITFVDDDDEKRGEVSINGNRMSIQQDENTYTRVITRYLQRDQNYLQITPKSTLRIAHVEVAIQ